MKFHSTLESIIDRLFSGPKLVRLIAFDLDTEKVIKTFGETNRARPYIIIKKYMLEHGFKHDQYSVYISNNPMSKHELNKYLIKMVSDNIWIKDCANKIRKAGIEDEFSDFMPVINNYSKSEFLNGIVYDKELENEIFKLESKENNKNIKNTSIMHFDEHDLDL